MVPIKRGTAWRLGIRRPPSFARGGLITTGVDADTPPPLQFSCTYVSNELAEFVHNETRAFRDRPPWGR